MIDIQLSDNYIITSESKKLLEAAVITALPDDYPVDSLDISWLVDSTSQVPVISGKSPDDLFIQVKGIWHEDSKSLELQKIILDGKTLTKPLELLVTPLNEMYIQANVRTDDQPPLSQSQAQLLNEMRLVQALSNPKYDLESDDLDLPDLFFNKMEFDYHFSKYSTVLEESILFWMEFNKIFSVHMDWDQINVPKLLANTIDRIYMFGPGRNKIMIELKDGTANLFQNACISVQIELCNEILSILPE